MAAGCGVRGVRPAGERGGALLTVLWLVAALTAIAFSVATTVRTETERTSTHIEQVRAYYLATGALDRALLWMNWGNGARTPDGRPRFYEPGMSVFNMMFPSGVASVEIIPESARLNVNRATPQELGQLLLMLGVPTGQVQAVTAGIVMARSSNGSNAGLPSISPTPGPTFRPRFASFEQIEELMYVPGVTPDLFHGTWSRGPNGALQRLPGLKDCLTVYGINDAYDINTTPAPVLMAIGVPPDLTAAIVQRRMMRPFVNQGELGPILGAAGPAGGKLRIGGNSTYTLRATATLRTQPPAFVSDVRRSASMVVKFNNNLKEDLTPYWILRWYDNAGTN
jgi:general secretion pathway protein K